MLERSRLLSPGSQARTSVGHSQPGVRVPCWYGAGISGPWASAGFVSEEQQLTFTERSLCARHVDLLFASSTAPEMDRAYNLILQVMKQRHKEIKFNGKWQS